jgi:hypothetical protein
VTDQITRPATLDDLKALLRSLNANGVDYLLIGGYALAAHGYQRATTDIDIVFPATAAAGQRAKDALMILPDQAAKEIEPQWFEEGENIRVADADFHSRSGSRYRGPSARLFHPIHSAGPHPRQVRI